MSTVLVVDDVTDNLYLLEALLTGSGFSVVTATDGVEALARARETRPDLVVSDILMPGMDGFALCREWRSDPDLAPIPFVFYTATYTDSRDEKLGLDLGADRFLVKPMEPDLLLAEIRGVMAQGRSTTAPDTATNIDRSSGDAVMREYNQALVRKLEQKLAELEVLRDREHRLNALLRAVRLVNKLVATSTEAKGLFDRVCAALAETAGYSHVWIAVAGPARAGGPMLAQAGPDSRGREELARLVADGDLPPCLEQVFQGERHEALPGPLCERLDCTLARVHADCDHVHVPLVSDGGRIVGVLGVVLPRETLDDVEEKPLLTELALDLARALRQMENAQAFRQLERRKEQYTRIVANAHDAMALIGPDSVYLEVNPAYEALIGRPAAEIVGHSVTEVLEASPPARSLEARVRACLAGETLRSESLQEIPRTGERFLSSVYSPCMDVDGSVSAVAVCVRDITERKRAEAELMEREERYRSLFYHDAAVKLLVDPETGQVLDANPAALEFYGRTADELCGALFDSITDRSPAQAKRHLDRVRNVTCLRFEDRHRLTGGTVRDVEVFSSRITVRGQEVLHLTVHDVTENRKLQEQMRQVQKLESVGRLAGSVAHDFNNLLMGIMGYTDLCRDELEPEHPVQEWLNEITAEAERSAALTRQLLAFARQQPVTPEVLDLNAAVGNMLKMLGRLIGENIDTRWMPADELWLVRMDPSQVDQVLANLCVNARDAIAGVGTVTIETANAMVDEAYCSDHVEAVPGPYVVLVVSDDGCGMAPEVRKRLFEPFFTTKSAGQGTGLGLATVHGIVKQNNGFINVYSEPGRGTTFRIYLPRFEGDAAVAGEDSSPVSAPDAFMGETTVLLVEDERSVRVTICLFLEEMGCRVIVADAPDLALRRVEEGGERIDLLVTDVVMPGMSGRDLAVELAGRFPAMKCLFVSGYTAVTIAQQEMLDEGAEFLSKPFTKEQLVDRVRRLLGP